MYTFYGNYFCVIYVYIVMGDYLCVFLCIYAHKKHKIVCTRWFLWELFVCDGFYENYLYNGLLCILLVCDGFFIPIVSFKTIFSVKRGCAYVLQICFLKLL